MYEKTHHAWTVAAVDGRRVVFAADTFSLHNYKVDVGTVWWHVLYSGVHVANCQVSFHLVCSVL